ncbi:RNA polymerase sigma factor [Streptomyces tubercidicus]|uniref:RNA polymerase sigma factor n=1 Tax=Streptomyces tubercidicus TaxID=47759 RepID=UPI0022B785A2|nr:hypothetical protein [Streptomyces tubercidicus]WAU09972.1 hypothetical protein STRTU_000002 [Streptomyces tubercidicus]WAU16355.1 hypothetical protein STRTU_007170 [Streptomyces tubercidicus]
MFSALGPDGQTLYVTIRRKVRRHLVVKFPQLNEADAFELTDAAILIAFRSGIDPERQPVAYVKKIAEREALDHMERRKPELLAGEVLDLLDPPAPTDAAVEGQEAQSAGRDKRDEEIWDLVDQATVQIAAPQCREVLARQGRGDGDDQIASDLGIKKNAVYQQRSRGVTALRAELTEYVRPGHMKPPQAQRGER